MIQWATLQLPRQDFPSVFVFSFKFVVDLAVGRLQEQRADQGDEGSEGSECMI